jgi:putative sterol carrier protein
VRDAKEYFATLEDRFEPSAAKDLHAIFQFVLSGPNACAYHVEVDDGSMKLQNGRATKADVTISASAEDYIKVVNGELGGVGAVMASKMKVRGNLALANRMKRLFPPGDKDK